METTSSIIVSHKLKKGTLILGLIIAFFGIGLLIGSYFNLHIINFTQFHTTKPITAICILFTGISITILSFKEMNKSSQFVVILLSILIACAALFSLFGMIVGYDISKNAELYPGLIQRSLPV